MPEWWPWSTGTSPAAVRCAGPTVPPPSGSESVVDRRLVTGVRLALELERAVLHVEVLAEARAQGAHHPPAVAVGERRVADDDVRREHRQSGGDRPGVQVVDADDAVHPGD